MAEAVATHPFRAWLSRNGLTNDRAAVSLTLSRVTLQRFFSGVRIMDLETKMAVEALTAGEVKAIDICSWEIARLSPAEAA